MLVPLCCYETREEGYTDRYGRRHFEAVAMLRECNHCSRERDFERRLRNYHPELRLGFDRRKGRYCIYRFTGRFLDIVYDLKWAWQEPTALRGSRTRYAFRDFGEWVFRHLSRWKPKQFEADGTWFGETLREIGMKNEKEAQDKFAGKVEAIVSDAMSIADKGNPEFVRTAVRVPEKTWEPQPV